MAKNVVEEFFIKLTADTKGATKDINSAMSAMVKKAADLKKRANKVDVQAMKQATAQKIDAEKQYNTVAYALSKKRQQEDDAAYKRSVDSAKVAYKKKVAITKNAVDKLVKVEDTQMKAMRAFYKKLEREAAATQKAKERLEAKAEKQQHARNKRRGKLIQQRIKDEKKAVDEARKNLQARLKAYKQEKKASDKHTSAMTKNIDRIAAADAKLKAQLETKAKSIMRTAYARDLEKLAPRLHGSYEKDMQDAIKNRNIEGMRDIASQMRDSTREMKRSIRGLAVVQNGLTDSTRNMIRSYASLFALWEGTTAIKRVGMELESLDAAMLAASNSQADAAEKMKFVKEEAYRLGTDLKTAVAAYMQLSIAGKGILEQEQIKDLFTATLEASAALGMSVDNTKGSFRSFVQMLSKGNVQAEELRGQLGERLYGAFNLAAESMGLTTKELNKQLQLGNVLAKDLLPKMTPMIREMANANGALATQLETARIAENRFFLTTQDGAKKIYDSGFSEGLKELYTTLSEILKDSGPQLEKIGKIFGTVFKAIAHILKLVEPPLKLIIDNIELLTSAYVIKRFGLLGKAVTPLKTLFVDMSKITGVNMISRLGVLGRALSRSFLPLTVALATAEELVSLFSDKLVGASEMRMGQQVNLATGEYSELIRRDGKYYKKMGSESETVSDKTPLSQMTEEQFDKLGFWEKAGLVAEQQHAMMKDMLMYGIRKFNESDLPKQNVTITQHNTIQAPSEDVAMSVYRRLTNEAINGR